MTTATSPKPATIVTVLQDVETLIATGWTQSHHLKRRSGRNHVSLPWAVVIAAADTDIADQVWDFLGEFAGDYTDTTNVAAFDLLSGFNATLPPNDGQRQALLFIAEAIDAAKADALL